MIIRRHAAAREVYDRALAEAWEAKNRLLELGVPREFALYVLPNATAVRFVESGAGESVSSIIGREAGTMRWRWSWLSAVWLMRLANV
ncbi:MAG: FAD-dependent thymidylate synthase [Burkholderiales bacterium]